MDNDFYSCQGTFNFTQNNDEVSMELKFDDSDNTHCAVYQKGSDLLEVLTAFIEDIDGQLAESDDHQADLEEMAQTLGFESVEELVEDAPNRPYVERMVVREMAMNWVAEHSNQVDAEELE